MNEYCISLLENILDELKAQKDYSRLIELANKSSDKEVYQNIMDTENRHAQDLIQIFIENCQKSREVR